MKILSFLGTTNYAFTKYAYKEKIVPTRFFAEALPHFFPKTENILVFVTPTVRSHSNLEELQSRLGNLLKPIPIPESHTEDALWEIFDALVTAVEPGERVVFDITNSFRSIPFLVFTAAAFLRSARDVDVEAVLYGAYEARSEKNVSPVFDLTPFVSLFDWLAAINQFLYTGNARYLAAQLRKRPDTTLEPLAENVENIALGLDLLRPRDVAGAAGELPHYLGAVRSALPEPFGVVVERLQRDYSTFAVENDSDDWAYLRSQLRMIDWYFEKQHYVHALAMAREWLVSLICLHFNEDMWDKDVREDAEILLSGGKRGDKESRHRDEWKTVPERKRLRRLWNEPLNLANLRNDVMHTGFRKNPKAAEEIIR
ncbi:TIGR02221 family CRISPR-associated protein, partial [Candidatus Parcubacteria bacterium]